MGIVVAFCTKEGMEMTFWMTPRLHERAWCHMCVHARVLSRSAKFVFLLHGRSCVDKNRVEVQYWRMSCMSVNVIVSDDMYMS